MSSGAGEAPPLREASGGPHSVVDIPGPAAEEHTTNPLDRKSAKSPPGPERSQAPHRNITEKSQLEAQEKVIHMFTAAVCMI
ncbi:hypothetical protein BDV93DRAFT_166966 [Ceratobasidium sp. AG-I]|nr:hypothetical protein BDV93DRAFT_166966 [Ceratobasidium sp. AG-I]